MRVVVTGASSGIGLATCKKFLSSGHYVFGIDTLPSCICESDEYSDRYTHFKTDVSVFYTLPIIASVDILVNNAGVQNTARDIEVNLIGLINTTKMYGLQPNIKSIVNLASVSAHNGAEFPEYVASKGGVLAYTVWTAKEVAKYGATCNSLSFGGVSTNLNRPVMQDESLWNKIMDMTPLKKWMSPEECAEWIYFLSVINKSCTGQDIIVDNGEMVNHEFIWN